HTSPPSDIPSPSLPSITSPISTPPDISFVNVHAFRLGCRLSGSQVFCLELKHPDSVSAHSATQSDSSEDLSSLLEEYHEFADIFSESMSWNLAEHHPYDLKINLEDGTMPPFG